MTDSLKKITDKHKSICWYPSAGADFRTLMFLSKNYYECPNERYSVDGRRLDGITIFPDLFIYTDFDYSPWNGDYSTGFMFKFELPEIWDGKNEKSIILYRDLNTTITADLIERIKIPVDFDLKFLKGVSEEPPHYGEALYLDVYVKSRQLGEFKTKLLYVVGVNECFANLLVKDEIKCDYVVLERYGECMGGAALSPVWIKDYIESLRLKYIVAPNFYFENSKEMNPVYTVNRRFWSKFKNVSWFKILS